MLYDAAATGAANYLALAKELLMRNRRKAAPKEAQAADAADTPRAE